MRREGEIGFRAENGKPNHVVNFRLLWRSNEVASANYLLGGTGKQQKSSLTPGSAPRRVAMSSNSQLTYSRFDEGGKVAFSHLRTITRIFTSCLKAA